MIYNNDLIGAPGSDILMVEHEKQKRKRGI